MTHDVEKLFWLGDLVSFVSGAKKRYIGIVISLNDPGYDVIPYNSSRSWTLPDCIIILADDGGFLRVGYDIARRWIRLEQRIE